MDVRVEMYRILLGCINSPDLTMHFRLGLIMIVRDLVLLSHFNFVEFWVVEIKRT